MNDLRIFNSPEFGEIRTIEINGEPWFVGKDVADILGYQNGSRDINRHVDEDDRQNYQNGTFESPRGMTVINESGLYSLILSSNMPSAKKFKHWVTSEVLPSIRKTGSYRSNREGIPLKEQVESLQAVADMLRMNDASKLLMLEGFYKGYNIPTGFLPKYEFNGSRQMKAATTLLKECRYAISAVRFNKMLVDQGYLEEKTRPSSKGKEAKFKSLTEKGLKYGENAVSPHNQKETQPLYYEDVFQELVDEVLRKESEST